MSPRSRRPSLQRGPRYVCVHGHFYQPPREDPWLEVVPRQDGAFPHHDFNAKITAECYGANAASRILDDDQHISEIVNNYERISFNIGPTLLSWMEEHAPRVYERILAADRESREHFGGHGSAMAQAYNHAILPLCNRRDKETQVRWGIRDFEHRFGRAPEGMWLPEAAVDTESLEVLAEHGIAFTLLAPRQADSLGFAHAESLGTTGPVDPRRPYRVVLPSGRSIAVFFYDGEISQAVAFEGLLESGARFAERLMGGFDDTDVRAQLVHIATDGESYGHHHRFGDMALAFALRSIEADADLQLTNYGEFLARHPPETEIAIVERSSWSCAHGVGRWSEDCGCRMTPGTTQAWRGPLRRGLNWLRDALAAGFENHAAELLTDPWGARDAYVDVVLSRTPERAREFVEKHAVRELTEDDVVAALAWLEVQRHAMLMFTSCGWFFDELSRIEALQILTYACRAAHLYEALTGDGLESGLRDQLRAARDDDHGDGGRLYDELVRPRRYDIQRVGAHHAIMTTLGAEPIGAEHCHRIEMSDTLTRQAGERRLSIGQMRIASGITLARLELSYAVLWFGDHHVTGGVCRWEEATHTRLQHRLVETFERGELTETLRVMGAELSTVVESLRELRADEQRQVAERLLEATVDELTSTVHRLHDRNAPLMRLLGDVGIRAPGMLRATSRLAVSAELVRALSKRPVRLDRAEQLFAEARAENVPLDYESLERLMIEAVEYTTARFRDQPDDAAAMRELAQLLSLGRELPEPFTALRAQEDLVAVRDARVPEQKRRASEGDEAASQWLGMFAWLADGLRVVTDPPERPAAKRPRRSRRPRSIRPSR